MSRFEDIVCDTCGKSFPAKEFFRRNNGNIHNNGFFKDCRICRIKKTIKTMKTYDDACEIIREHHEETKYDSKCLTTEFMQNLIRRKC